MSLAKAKQPVPEYNTKKGNNHTAKRRGKQHKHSHPNSEPEQAQPYQSPHDSSGKYPLIISLCSHFTSLA